MTIKGDFNTLFLADILQLLCNHGKTGVLKAHHGEHEVKTFIKEGEIICVMGSKESNRLGNILVHNRVISEEQLTACLDTARKEMKALGKILIRENLVTESTLCKFIDRQAEDIILDMLLWEAGDFVYSDYDLDVNDLIIPRLNVMKVLMQATRRIDEMSVLSKLIPSDQIRFKLLARTDETEKLQLDEIERNVLPFIQKGKSVREIIDTLSEDEFLCYKAFYALLSSGVIKRCTEPPQHPENEKNRFLPATKAYIEILAMMKQQIKPVLGSQTSEVFDLCKPAKNKTQEALLKNFHPDNNLDDNALNLVDILQRKVKPEEQQKYLVDTFNSYIYNLLEKLPGFMGEAATQDLLKKIEEMLAEL
jgi:hypothetical protein